MVNTPPPPNPAPGGDATTNVQADALKGSEDVSSILANLSAEQLASIMDAARASGGASTSDATSGVDTTAILASLPPGLGQAASALTSFASSFKRANNQGQEREGVEGATGGEVDGTVDGDSKELKQSDSQHQQQSYDAQHGQHDVQHENQHDDQQSQQEQQQQQQQSHHEDDEQHQQQQQHQQQSVDRYGDATAAALAAMESLAAQGGLSAPMNHRQGRQKRELGPEAERLRKDNHKEVERKRREQISSGINELAAIVPSSETSSSRTTNKTAIIHSAVEYIQRLKNNEADNIEKWTLEKLLMDQAVKDLNQQLEDAKKEISRLRGQLGLPEEVPPPQHHDQGEEMHHHQQHHDEQQQQHQQQQYEEHQPQDDHHHEHHQQHDVDPRLNEGADRQTNALNEVAAAAAAAAAALDTRSQQDVAAATVYSEDDGSKPRARSRSQVEIAEEGAVDKNLAMSDDGSAAAGGRAKRSRQA